MVRVALVGPEIEENLSLRYLSAALAAQGCATDIVPFDSSADLPRVLAHLLAEPSRPGVVGLTLSFQWRAKDFLALAVALRERGFAGHITAGGHFGTFAHRELLRDFPEIDSICLQEAEDVLAGLVRAVVEGRSLATVPGLAYRDPEGRPTQSPQAPVPDLSRLPWPDRRGEPRQCLGHRIAPMIASRGCYARCEFCCIAAWHEQTLPGKRYRGRPLSDVADEMAWLHRERGIHIFLFHDDNFFLPTEAGSLARVGALADALASRGMGRFATVVKARPTDMTEPVVAAMQERLGLLRVYLGVETDSEQGLRTLGRNVPPGLNGAALARLERAGVYVCFNMLLFDPDTTLDTLGVNLRFLREHADVPHNFGRVELYAGTPLLSRMLAEGRCRGDYLGWDYRLHDPVIERVFDLAMACFYGRNFAAGSIANRLMGTRFDVEVARCFHPAAWQAGWLARSQSLSRDLTLHSLAVLEEIIAFARSGEAGDRPLLQRLEAELRRKDADLAEGASRLEAGIEGEVGRQSAEERRGSAEITGALS